MKKYWLIFQNSLQTSFAYRTNFFAMLVSEGLSLLVMIYLWLSIYHQGNQIGAYSLRDLIYYYLFSKLVILVISSGDLAREVAVSIRDGNFSAYLTKPLSFFGQMASMNAATGAQRLFIFSLVAVLLFATYLGFPSLSMGTLAVFLLALLIGYCLFVLINFIIGISIFYVGYVSGLNFLMFNIGAFFSGRLVPLDLLPAQYSQLVAWLPFQYMVYVPTAIITGKLSAEQGLVRLLPGLAWIASLGLFTVFYYRRGLRKFESYGS